MFVCSDGRRNKTKVFFGYSDGRQNETNVVTSTNLYSYTNPTNLFIKLVVLIICTNIEPSLQNFIKIINSNTFNYLKNLNYYNNNINKLDEKILNIVMNHKQFMLNEITLSKILFSHNIH